MDPRDNLLRIYKELADWYERQRQPQMRDRFLVLAADAALLAGKADEAEKVRLRLLKVNPHHMLKPYTSFAQALKAPDVLTYVQMMQRYAGVAGLRPRIILPVPVLSPRLSAHWVNVVTPVPAALAKPLVRSLVNEVVWRSSTTEFWISFKIWGIMPLTMAFAIAQIGILKRHEAPTNT